MFCFIWLFGCLFFFLKQCLMWHQPVLNSLWSFHCNLPNAGITDVLPCPANHALRPSIQLIWGRRDTMTQHICRSPFSLPPLHGSRDWTKVVGLAHVTSTFTYWATSPDPLTFNLSQQNPWDNSWRKVSKKVNVLIFTLWRTTSCKESMLGKCLNKH